MRLLKYRENEEISIVEFNEDTKPPYAILSHRWGAEADEVTFEDVTGNTGKHKTGYAKIYYCGEQAQRDGLQYFWIDTCCINRANRAELSLAIQSMFRWYRNAVRCYAYLWDVSASSSETDEGGNVPAWEADFRGSEWFTRGWTLQELLAPSSVDFFTREWKKLGDKRSLMHQVHEVTGIPRQALQGAPLSEFSINKRLRWIEHRRTTYPEDKAYSLLGVVGVDLAPCYGEGADGAFRRLHDEIDKTKRCIQDLCGTDSRDDKKRIEDTKGGLLKDFRLLWIKGDPGKGKTMLLCGIIDELQASSAIAKTNTVSYFFCQATDARINSAAAVLRGLLYLLVSQQPSLASGVRKKYDHAGKNMFEDTNAWVALAEMLADVLRNPSLTTTYLIIDALDECVTDLPKLLDFIAKQSSASSRVKWIVSSRNWPDIEEHPGQAGHTVRLSLELNAASQNRYDERTKSAVLEHLASNANDTFLWVALVCQDLQATAKRNVLRKLDLFPPGLHALYERMMQQISNTDDAELCKQVLAAVALVYQPITHKELVTIVEPLEDVADDTVYFVHQSAKDFLITEATQGVFPAGQDVTHQAIFARSLKIMSKTLRRDMYGLKALGTSIEDIEVPERDPLAALRYSCVHWVDHLCDLNPTASATYAEHLRDKSPLQEYVTRRSRDEKATDVSAGTGRVNSVHSACTYGSALLFSPRLSLVRRLFQHEEPEGVAFKPGMSDGWSACLQTLEGHGNSVWSVAFSHDSTWLASASRDRTVKIWDASSGACLQTLKGHSSVVYSVAFSHDSTRLASASKERTVKIWDTSSGACLQTLKGHSDWVRSVAFSHNSTRLASASWDKTVKLWDASSGVCLQTLKGHSSVVSSVAFSHDSTWLASASWDRTLKVWNASSGVCLQTLEGHSDSVNLLAISHDSTRLASASDDRTVKVWDASSDACLQTLDGHSDWVRSVAFSHDSTRLASASKDRTVKIWDASSGACLQTLKVGKSLRSLSFDATNSCLFTKIGSIDVSASMGSGIENAMVHQRPKYLSAGVSLDSKWITCNGKNVLWIPSEFRPLDSSVCRDKIGIGVRSGRVWICSVNIQTLSQLCL
ncbi:WD40 repeat-like protein [Lizonia empirigonia]|nr:WD40 repeat-like protein [Lizonia empirigonia]